MERLKECNGKARFGGTEKGLNILIRIFFSICLVFSQPIALAAALTPTSSSPIVIIEIDGPISPASDDFLKTSLLEAKKQNARLFVLKLNTPGGLLPSMQSMVESLLGSPVPTVVYVSPRGGGAISAGVFITMAGHVAAMAPGTTIGAAHPVSGDGQDIQGDMREKIENFAVIHLKAIATERGRNIEWAEKAVRESVAIDAREALDLKVVDMISGDLDSLLKEIEGQTVSVQEQPVTLVNLTTAPKVNIEMTLKQKVVNILADPNIAVLLGLGAMLGIGLELYHPGGILPGVIGVICLVLSLVAAQVLPINEGGVILFILGAVFFVVEMFSPSFGIFGGAGIACMVLGALYFIDGDTVWSSPEFEVNKLMVGTMAAMAGSMLLGASWLAMRAHKRQVSTGKQGMLGEIGELRSGVKYNSETNQSTAKVFVRGEIWKAVLLGDQSYLQKGKKVQVEEVREGLSLEVKPLSDSEE